MIAAVTDLDGKITGVHRTWLDRSGRDKAPIASPRRAMGELLGNGVRFGAPLDVMAAGEGIETVLSVRCLLPSMPMIAALSSAHLAAILFPKGLAPPLCPARQRPRRRKGFGDPYRPRDRRGDRGHRPHPRSLATSTTICAALA